MIKLIFIVTPILIIILGCTKDDPFETVHIDNRLNNFMFSEYSYWIYKSANNEIDSVVLSYKEHGYYWNPPSIPSQGQPGTKREYYKMLLESKTHNYQDIDLIESDRIRRNPETEWYICGQPYYSPTPSQIFEYIDSIFIGDNVFYDVIKRQIIADNYADGCSNSGFYLNTDFYTAPGYGIIKKVIHDNDSTTTWDLVRWKIIK